MRLLYLSKKQSISLAQGQTMAEWEALLPEFFPGSVIYGPGYDNYNTNDVQEILEEYGGENSFDAIFCILPEQELAGNILALETILRYQIPSNLWQFPVNLGRTRLPKIFGGTDFWHLSQHDWNRVIAEHGFSIYSTPFVPPFISMEALRTYFSQEVLEKVICIPFPPCISETLFHHPKQAKEHDVLLAGAQALDFYPVRWEMAQAFRASDLSLCEPKHPGYSQLEEYSKPSSYVQDLCASRISAFCSSKFQFPPLKLFEAFAAHTVAMCDAMHGVKHLGLIPDKHFILANGTNCVEKARRWLADPSLYQETVDAAYDVFRKRHTVKIRLAELAEEIPHILNGEPCHGWADLSPNFRQVRTRNCLRTKHSPPEPVIHQRSFWDYPIVMDQKTWDFWYRLSPMPLLTKEFKKIVRVPFFEENRRISLGHLEAFKAQLFLNFLDDKIHTFLEVGTGIGFYSLLWSSHMERLGFQSQCFAEDPIEENVAFRPATTYLHEKVTRKLLWAGIPAARRVQCIPREPGRFHSLEGKKLDCVFFNQSDNLLADFEELRDSIGTNTHVVINNYGNAFPEIVEATKKIAIALNRVVDWIDFSPAYSGLALLPPSS